MAVAAGLGVCACGDDDQEPEVPSVTMAPGTSADIVVKNYQSVIVGKVNFNAVGEWSAEVLPANSSFEVIENPSKSAYASRSFSKVDWLEVNPFSGGTGSQSLQMFLIPNHTNSARYAVIKVNSVSNNIIFRVTQEGMAGTGGDTPAPSPDPEV